MSATRPTARTVAVHGSGSVQGSGALLTDRLVPTCAHVVKGRNRAVVAHPDLPSTFTAWESLLLAPAAREGLIDPSPPEALPGLRVDVIGGSRIIGGEGLIAHT
ncbi:hypothetical protein ACFU6I_13350 [Streptomyces sp. NPDC057486]|uniref:hypothetical protein n=1 Tax=Streptomyces sp. NPDC057486 TaxID=3346145 RepID=UPI0036BB6731